MSQKTILSFFKSKDVEKPKEVKSKSVVINDSPVKKSKNKRKVQCLESDDESSDLTKKDLNGHSNGDLDATENAPEKSSDQSSEKENEETNEIEKNEILSSGKPSKMMKTENSDKQKLCASPKKAIADSSKQLDECVQPSSSSDIKCDETSGSSNQNGFEDFIPKRKTARKQMSSSKSKRNYVKPETDDVKSEISETKASEESVPSDVTIKKEEIENSEEQPEEESPSRVTVQIKEEPKDKKSTKDIKKPSDKKRKVAVTPKSKATPVKKSATKESIQSFFNPVKKPEEDVDNMEVDEDVDTTKSNQEEHEDSPVKKGNRLKKKKVQCLESDDEENENPDISGETNGTELNTSSASLEKNEDADKTTPEDSAVEEKISPEVKVEVKSEDEGSSKGAENQTETSAKEADKNSKDDVGKMKLSVKSTSAVTIVYDPSKYHYHPIEDACWKRGEKVPYLALAKTLELIENISGRLKIIEILSNFLRSVIVLSPDDMLQSVYLCLNRLAPEYAGIELGVGDMLLMKAVAQATGRTVEKIKAEVAVKGDLGLVSETSRGNQRVMFAPPKLTVSSVFQKFLEIAKMTGNSSMAKKIGIIKGLFVACRDCEAKYIIRSLSGKLRIGLAEQSVLSAIARAAVLTPPGQPYPPEKLDTSKGMSSEKFKEKLDAQILILKTAYCECPNYDLIIPVLLKEGISALPERCQLAPGVPLKPMLAHPTDGIDKVLERFDKNAFTCEFKYDGERAQIHRMESGDVKIFSRNQEDNTSKYPDIISRLSNAVKETTKTFILDSEAVAWDKGTKQILPFQVLSTRKRKDAVESEIVVQVCIMAFDLLYLNGESLVKKSLKERRSLLHSSFNEVENEFMFAQYRDGDSAETMQEFLDESVKGNCEGLMVKALEIDASYEIAKRSHNWLKLKKDYLQGIGDTLDLVVIGGYYGKGKRTGNYGGFLLACYDEENEEFQSICKLGTGFKDDILEAHTKFLKGHVIEQPKSYFRYDHSLQPDEWFEPIQVWEIKCADLSISPVHKAAVGIVDPEKGISLRFPRFIRIRDDKTPEIATNSAQIAEMYQRQQQIQNTSNKNAKVDEDYY